MSVNQQLCMHIMKKIIAAVALSVSAVAAHATTFGFSDSDQSFITNTHDFMFSGGYGDYSWINGSFADLGAPVTTLGYAWSNGATDLSMASPTGAFTFNSVSLYESSPAEVTLTGFLHGSLVESYTATLLDGAFSTVALDWSSIDQIVFSTNGMANLFVTDITVNAAHLPEPDSIVLLGLGLVGVAAVRRYGKKSV